VVFLSLVVDLLVFDLDVDLLDLADFFEVDFVLVDFLVFVVFLADLDAFAFFLDAA